MSTALYRRYRPETFAEVIGQEQVTVPLMTALEKNRVNHAYLFSGPRGCGKTTSARILARCLNCAQGPTPTPCGVCDSCRELSRDGGGSLDVIEMDAASHGGVDHARDLRERATLAPVRDRYKIFIIDEAHMVTREGFNALLKIVEEPPEHVKFIFATTEPNKVLGTIRSRTHHYPFRLVPPEVLLPYLQSLCDQEQVAVEPGVLQLVIRAGGGSVRDSLSILDQLMAGASSEKGIEYDLAVALLGYTHAQLLDEVVEALGAREASTLFGAVSRVVATGQDPRRFVEDLLERLRDLIVVKAVPQSAAQILQGVPQDQLERLAAQAQALTERELTLAAGTVNDALNGMTGTANPQLQLELLCARLLLPVEEGSANGAEVAALASRLQVLERRVAAGGSAPASVQTGSQAGSQAPAGMSAARAAGMAAAGLTPKTQAPNAQAPSAPVQEAAQQGGSQQAGASAPPLAGGPLSSAPLAPAAQAPSTRTPAAPVGAPLAGTTPTAPNAPASPAADAAPEGTPSAPLKLNPNDPLAAVQGNWRAILNRMSVPGSAEQLAKVYPARMEGTVLYVRADIATLRAVKGYVPELTARVSEFLRGPVTIHAEVVKPGEPLKPGAPVPQREAQPAAPTPQQPTAPLAEGPRGGEDAWRRHGQPVNDAAAPAATSVDAPLGAWDVAPIPQSEEAAPAAAVEPSPAEPFPAQVPPTQPEPSPHAGPLSQPGTDAPAGGFGERDSFAASGSGVPQEAPGRSDAQEPPFEDEPPYDAEPSYNEPAEAMPEAPEAAAPAAEPIAPAGPLAAGPLAPAPANESASEPVTEPEPPAEPASSEVVPTKPVHVVTEEDYISEDDEKVENSTFIGLRAIEKIIGGTVIDERPLHQG
ncbi:DNA polymerase III subunit gamma and tau [uncultured Rothia sp.]|uniref:DNA polymerase III subunit gamma and tau n=1 Tax=uncultured Rothia sp. TaxID=316088 RepID=UPI0025E830BD|nr:DNA polymerase III subunit gamma and tau [uncultured Rothia sp.]